MAVVAMRRHVGKLRGREYSRSGIGNETNVSMCDSWGSHVLLDILTVLRCERRVPRNLALAFEVSQLQA